ncbi:MAG: HAMP domain-containing histidine kinase [Bacteriovoracaceae bacterium]|nr:HAMP domain-containing histidine kinase [Bacteriovoracaceae bacterium]
MIRVLLLSILFLASNVSYANFKISSWEVCFENNQCHKVKIGNDLYQKFGRKYNQAIYKSQFELNDSCIQLKDCTLFLGEIADTAKVTFNGQTILSFSDDSYIRHQSTSVQIPSNLIKSSNDLEIIIKDKNQNLFGLLSNKVLIGSFASIRKISLINWLQKTGITLICSLILFLLFIGLIINAMISKKSVVILVANFSGIASLYLFSLSEVPREFANPLYLSGPVHFSLLLLQAFTLFLAVSKIFALKKFKNIIRAVSIVYTAVITFIFISSFFDIESFLYYKKIILVAAPLISLPFIYLFFISSHILDEKEKKVVKMFSAIFSTCIALDTLSFWQLIKLGFTIKYILPAVTLLLIWVLLTRKANYEKSKEKDYTVGKITRQFVHDIKVDIECFQMLFNSIESKLSKKELDLARFSLDSFYQSIQKIRDDKNFSNREIFNLKDFADFYLSSRKKYFESEGIELQFELDSSWINQSKKLINEIFNNMIRNALQANASKIIISSHKESNLVVIEFTDNGKGMDDAISEKVFDRFFTTKKEAGGQGIGLSKIKESIELMGGKIEVKSKVDLGTTFKMTVPLSLEEKEGFKAKPTQSSKSYVLVDDDFLVRTTWTLVAQMKNVDLICFSSSSEILDKLGTISKDAQIYLDYNLDEDINGVQLAEKLASKGFEHLYLATGQDFDEQESKRILEASHIKGIQGKTMPLADI